MRPEHASILAASENRDLFVAWIEERLTEEEAVFLARRSYLRGALDGCPAWLEAVALFFFDLWKEPVRPARKEKVDTRR